jgi:hypothetical protein
MSTYKVIKTFKNGETNTIDNLSVSELQGLIKADTGKWFDDAKECIAFYTQYDFHDFTVTVVEKESLYKQLRAIITKNNAIYEQSSDEIFEIESNVNKSAEAVEHAKRKRWQFMHNYATELSTFIWDHITELQARDLSVFDMVPSPVWNKMSEKNEIIVKAILDKYNEAKDGKANAK